MSSVLNHVPCHLGVPALRAARPLYSSGRRQKCSCCLLPPVAPARVHDAGVRFPSFKQWLSTSSSGPGNVKDNGPGYNGQGAYPAQISSNTWWSELRSQSPLNQSFTPSSTSNRSKADCADGKHDLAEDKQLAAGQRRLRKRRRSQSSIAQSVAPANKSHGGDCQDGTNYPTTSRAAGTIDENRIIEQTPTDTLIDSLRKTGHKPDVGRPSGWTTDLSWVSPDKPISNAQRQKRRSIQATKRPARMSFQTILADYMIAVDPLMSQTEESMTADCSPVPSRIDKALATSFSEAHIEYLGARGYSAPDVMAWAWILKSERSYEAALKLFMLEDFYRTHKDAVCKRVPPFIPLFILRRRHLDAKAYRLLLLYCLHLMGGRPLPIVHTAIRAPSDAMDVDDQLLCEDVKSRIDPTMCMTFVVRLLRHARQVWPQAQLSIARVFASFLTHLGVEGNITDAKVQRLNRFRANKFNACLWLLSLPSKPNPFTSASIQQRAQFELLKAMAAHHPVLPVTRRGYQGIIAVQLAHKKTPAERLSAELKAVSWPPWKEEKLGIDSKRGNEGLKSRAIHVMSQMKEAGYSHTQWEEVAAVLAGWDTDRSPTIQTRALMPRPHVLAGPQGSNPDHPALWVARIRATRTVREAWACFLAYHDRGLSPHRSIYFAMAQKLVFRRKAIESRFDQSSLALPGDGPEVFPEPSSARDLIYVHTEPPALDDLLKQMLSRGIRPSGRFLAMLLQSAATFNSGMNYICCSDLSDKQVQALCTIWPVEAGYENAKDVDSLPDYLFSSFIRFLCKFSNFDPLYVARHDFRTSDLFPILLHSNRLSQSATTLLSYAHISQEGDHVHHPKALAHAVQLMRMRRPKHPRAWIALLSALSGHRISIPYHKMNQTVRRILAWHEVLEVTAWMAGIDVEPVTPAFHILCHTFSKAVVAGIKHPNAAEEALRIVGEQAGKGDGVLLERNCETFEEMVHSGLDILKRYFDRIVLPGSATLSIGVQPTEYSDESQDPQVTTPPMLQVPSPAVLHAFVRALGVAEDYDGLLNLLQWMSRSAPTLKEGADELMNGERMMRRTLVAVRVFLEGFLEIDSSRAAKQNPHVLNDPESSETGFLEEPSAPSGKSQLEFSDAYVQEAHDIIESTELWGPWPTDDEVREYILWDPSTQG